MRVQEETTLGENFLKERSKSKVENSHLSTRL